MPRFDWKRPLLAFVLVGSGWFVPGAAEEAHAADEDYRFNYYADHAEIRDYRGTDTEIVLPETSGGLPVTAIADGAFWHKDLTKVTLPASLETIGDYAFYENQLMEIEIPARVTSIGRAAFAGNQLSQVILPEGLQWIGGAVFQGSVIREIEIPASVHYLEMNAFNGIGLTKLKLNEGLPEVGYAAFVNNELTEVQIPSTAKRIVYAAFRNNKLNKVLLNEGLEEIWYSTFENNELTSVVIPSTVNTIYGDAFLMNKLAFAVIPPSVSTIEHNSFAGNPAGFTIIGEPGSPAHDFATTYGYSFKDAASIPLPDIQIAPGSQGWAQSAETTVTGATYNIFNLKYAWSNTETAPGPEAEWRLWGPGDEIEQTAEGEWYLHVQGSLLDRTDAWRSDGRFRVDRTPPTLDVTMTAGPSATPYADDTWSTRPVTVNATATDPYGEIREIVVEIDNGSSGSVAAYPGGAYSVTFATYGTYEMKITAIDQAGNASVMEQRTVKIDHSSPPSTSSSVAESGNARLKEMIFSNGTLDPVFSGDVTEYTLRIDPVATSVTLNLSPEHTLAKTSLNGQSLGSGSVKADVSLESDKQKMEIVVTAEDGTKRTYKVVLVREGADPAEAPPTSEACAARSAFTDIAGHWGEPFMVEAGCQGIVQGYPDGRFGPDRTVTRAEFTVRLAGVFDWENVETALLFSDLAGKEHWAGQAIAQAAAAGIVYGYPDGRFGPDATITRAEMAAMIARAMDLRTDAGVTATFADDADIPAWAKGAVASIRRLGIVVGRGGNRFAPNGAATRAEAAVMLLRAGEQLR